MAKSKWRKRAKRAFRQQHEEQKGTAVEAAEVEAETTAEEETRHKERWEGGKGSNNFFPYEINYNDHFETPLIAYQDLRPMLKWIQSKMRTKQGKDQGGGKEGESEGQTSYCHENKHTEKPFTLYDPYYCNGRTKILLKQLGFDHVVHEKRDFYKDIEQEQIPVHDVLITNPPYSDEHKQQCLAHCLSQPNQAFCLLMPNYVACRN